MDDVQDLEPGQAMMVDWTAEEYHSDRTALTRSSLGLMPDNPHAMRKWLAGEERDDDGSATKSLGTLEHMAILEPEMFAARVLPEPGRPADANGSAAHGTPGRIAWEGWQSAKRAHAAVKAESPDALAVKPSDTRKIIGMTTALLGHPEAGAILRAPGLCEQTIVWREPTTGMLVKVRADKLLTLRRRDVFGTKLEPGDYVFDLKTTEDDTPRQFVRTLWRHGCVPQAALYTDAAEALLGQQPTWLFGAVTQAPVEEQLHGVSVYTMTDEQLARGREIYRAQMIAVMERRETNDWTPAHRRGVNILPM